jgi:hypothetical protein
MKGNDLFNLILNKIKAGEIINIEVIQETLDQNNDFSEVRNLVFNLNATNAQKRKYFNSILLSKIVLKTFEWFKSQEGLRWMESKNLNWTNEEIGKNIFGWQKSFFYKLLRTAKLNDKTLIAFDKYCETNPDNGLNRSIENLLKFARTFKIDDDSNVSVLEKELKKFKRIVSYQRRIFRSLESIKLAEEIISKIDLIISSATNSKLNNFTKL